MEKILIVGGTFDNNGGKPSSMINKFVNEFKNDNIECDVVNGGYFHEIEQILESTINYKYVIWWANIPNHMPKIRNVKEVNPKCILVTSKRNDNKKYGFAELINRALAVKANLCVEFSKWNDIYAMRVFDPLGNQWYHGYSIIDASRILVKRMAFLSTVTRQASLHADRNVLVPNENEFFSIIKDYANVFHDLIQPDKEVTRFLGNSSFRCQRGFPSFRNGDKIFVSRRNIDKRYIDKDGFVPVKMDDSVLWYYGEHKPSVDTPIQTRLYEILPNINYMIHAHVYIDGAPFTKNNIPCGGIEEVKEIMDVIGNNTDDEFYAINLIGHGCIVMAKNVEQLKNIKYIARKMPENIVN